MQDFKIPAVRVNALLSGFQFGDRKGDAVITQSVAQGNEQPDSIHLPVIHRKVVLGVINLLKQLATHNLGHENLSADSFIYSSGKVYLKDGIGITSSGLLEEHLRQFAHNTSQFASTTDRIRVWYEVMYSKELPLLDDSARRFNRDLKNDKIETIIIDNWRGRFRSEAKYPVAHSLASKLDITRQDWAKIWPEILVKIERDQFDVIKRDDSCDILSGSITLQNRPIDIIIKRPRNKFWYRYFYDLFRSSRAARLFDKTRWLQVRHIPVEYPLAVFEKSKLGYVIDGVAVFERVPGVTLDQVDLQELSDKSRENLFRRCGRLLRIIEETGLTHTDAKSTNWIVFNNDHPVLIDAYGIRKLTSFLQLFGIQRLLRAMRHHPQYSPNDSLNLCLGFAPRKLPEEVK